MIMLYTRKGVDPYISMINILIPQLSPINWLVLFIYFILLLYFTAVKIFYFSKTYEKELGVTAAYNSNKTLIFKI